MSRQIVKPVDFINKKDEWFDFIYSYDVFDDFNKKEVNQILSKLDQTTLSGCIETWSPGKILFLEPEKRYISWTDYHTNTLNFLKVNRAFHDEIINITIVNDIYQNMLSSQLFFHNFYLWDEKSPMKIKIHDIRTKLDYIELVRLGNQLCINNTEILRRTYL